MTQELVPPAWLTDAIDSLAAGDMDGWMALYAEDAVHEFPFAGEDAPQRLVGRAEIAAFMSELPERVRFGSLFDVRARTVGDELIVEATGRHRSAEDDTPFELRYVWFITHRDGEVSHIRDYMSPWRPLAQA